MVKTLELKNFMLFKEAKISFDKINIITGINLDDSSSSSNGAGKSTIINAIMFALYGDVPGLTLKDLVMFNAKECSVKCTFVQNNEQYEIIRKIPTELTVIHNEKEVESNTLAYKQKVIDDMLGNSTFFKTYRTIDTHKGINLLDQGIISLRKALMTFIDSYFEAIRKRLLAKKNEREKFNIDKKPYTYYLSGKRQLALEVGLHKLTDEEEQAQSDINAQYTVVNNLKADKSSKIKLIGYKQQDLKKLNNGYCPILGSQCEQLVKKQKQVESAKANEISAIEAEIVEIDNLLINEEELLQYYKKLYAEAQEHARNCTILLSKLNEAFKFNEYKYTLKDVEIYTEAVKVVDNFAAYYINQWLDKLAFIINDLLAPMNLQVEFTADKEFLTIKNGESLLKFEQLSSGQKTFLSSVFKVAILLNNGMTTGLIVIDEGLSNLDKINLDKFLTVLNNLQFQSLLIYQNIDKDLTDVNFINIERKNGESIVRH